VSLLKFLSREKLVEYLDQELRPFLNDREIYDIDHYGWVADNHADPDYLGLAMWQTDPPAKREPSDLSGIPPGPAWPECNIAEITKKGMEFEKLMKSSRHSIGLSHLYHQNPGEMSSCFDFHFSETVMKLTMAADRLRDFFIIAFSALPGFTEKTGVQESPSGPGDQLLCHCRPYLRARDILAGDPGKSMELFDCLTELPALAERLCFYRDSQSPVPGASADIEILIDWYKLTIDTGNKIFLAEYLLRNFSQTPRLGHIVEYR